jgi:prolyl 4-hydroxylase
MSNRLWLNLVLTVLTGGFATYYYLTLGVAGGEPGGMPTIRPGAVMQKITVTNELPAAVSLYFKDDNSVTGTYMQGIDHSDTVEVLATAGDQMFATLEHGYSKLASFTVKEERSQYSINVRDPVALEAAFAEAGKHRHQPSTREGGEGEGVGEGVGEREGVGEERGGNVQMKGRSEDMADDAGEAAVPKQVVSNKSGRETLVSLDVRHETRTFPGVKNGVPKIVAMPARFRSLYPSDIDMWYDNGQDGVFQGRIKFGKESSTTTYQGHEFYFTLHDESTGRSGKKGAEVGRWKMDRKQSFYLVEDPAFIPVAGSEEERVIGETFKEIAYMKDYEQRTGQLYYASCRDADRSFLPRAPPVHHMWPADEIGQVHSVQTPEGFWHCDGPASECQDSQGPLLELEVLSLKPRAFAIKEFLSEFEVQQIIDHSKSHLKRSSVGEGENSGGSDTRTSENTWLPRERDDVTRSLFKRAADLLQIQQEIIRDGSKGIAEQLQVVHYQDGQRYDPHYDWGATRHADRYLTLLLYLTDMAHPTAGGQTSFPRGEDRNGETFKIHPGARSAVLFYNILPDGNNDDASLHSATAVTTGEKFLANFWVWDPEMKH